MKLQAILEAVDENDDAAFNAMLFGRRIKAAGFVEWKPINREDDEVFERVTYYRSPAFYAGRYAEDDDEFTAFFEIEAYPISLKPGNNKGERYIAKMGTQINANVVDSHSEGIQLGARKDVTEIKKTSTDPSIMLKHVDAMLAAYKKYVESKYKKVPR